MPNRLAGETSPYLLQHQNNPVHWQPWDDAALQQAQREQTPIFLSIGYSACHWCHVMEHESFEDPRIAGLLNDSFVCIKVDREERPDLDQIYMHAVQMMTGRGGWPMSVFLTPDGRPFFGGTYWPPEQRMGMPGFDQVIEAVRNAWENRRDDALANAQQLTAGLSRLETGPESSGELSLDLLHHAAAALERGFDFQHGGFGQAPKFPHAMDLGVLLRYWRREQRDGVLDMVRLTLDKMAGGGIYDHLGGGFARYSVDAQWLTPHFEKMLYDNALLAGIYLDGYRATGDENYARVVRETLDYTLRDMSDPAGGFYSTEDADSEGEEGKFYVWTPAELREALGEEQADTFAHVYDVSETGNFEGRNILNLPKTIKQCAALLDRDEEDLATELAESRTQLLAVRDRRVRPGRDDKVLASWNGLMIDSMARAAGVLNEPKYLEAANRAADFVLAQMVRDDGRLLHSWRGGAAKLDAYLDDYAALANALVSLYEASFDERRIDQALELVDRLLTLFRDETQGGFYFTASDHEKLLARPKSLQDGSEPSGNALAATALLRLGALTGRADLIQIAGETLQAASSVMREAPSAAGQMLIALDLYLGPGREAVLLGDASSPDAQTVLAHLRRQFLPRTVVACRLSTSDAPRSHALESMFTDKDASDEQVALFVCENFACQTPVSGPAAAIAAIDEFATSK